MSIDDFMSEEEYVSQMHKGALLNPRVDSTFKALFTQPTTESKEALHSFLEAATERKIASFTLSPNDAPGMFPEQRGVSYDILCVFDDGLSADIEMQAFNQKYDYGKTYGKGGRAYAGTEIIVSNQRESGTLDNAVPSGNS